MKHAKLAVAMLLLFFGLSTSSWAQDQSLQYYQAGNTTYSQKNYDMAIRYYQAATQINPQMWQAYQGMGNCYYAKGDKQNALTNYQKALSINSNNPQLSSFVQTLQAQVGTAPAQTANTGFSTTPASSTPKSTTVPKTFELAPFIGVGVAGTMSYAATSYGGYSAPATSYDAGMGIGGGLGGYYLLDKNLGIGLVIDYFIYDKTTSTPVTSVNSSFQQTVGTINLTGESDLIELMPSVKYTLDGNGLRPYFIGSLGFCLASTSASASYGSWSNGTPPGLTTTSASAAGPSYSGPMAQLGVGGEYALGDTMNLFLQVKYNMIFAGNSTFKGNQYPGFTFSSIPIEAGMSFDF